MRNNIELTYKQAREAGEKLIKDFVNFDYDFSTYSGNNIFMVKCLELFLFQSIYPKRDFFL